jgi:hypothetical protein
MGKKPIEYMHPKLKLILEKTYGICIYQEQLMQIARDVAGFSLPEADTLRKAIGKKIPEEMDLRGKKTLPPIFFHPDFTVGCGYPLPRSGLPHQSQLAYARSGVAGFHRRSGILRPIFPLRSHLSRRQT